MIRQTVVALHALLVQSGSSIKSIADVSPYRHDHAVHTFISWHAQLNLNISAFLKPGRGAMGSACETLGL